MQEIGVQRTLAFYDDTPLGVLAAVEFIHVKDTVIDRFIYQVQKTDSLDTYVMLRDTLVLVEELHNFRVYGYSKEKDILMIGKWDSESAYETGIEAIYSFDLNTRTFKEQGSFMGGVYGLQVNQDRMYVRLNVKSRSGVGSQLLYVPFAIK